MGRNTFTILFFIKRSKLLRNNEAPIYLRITVNGIREEISIRRSIKPEDWNESKGVAEESAEFSNEINQYLNQIRHEIYQHHLDLKDRKKTVSASALKNAFLKNENDDDITILEAYQEHNEDLKIRIDKGVSRSTYIRHTTSKKHLEAYIKYEYKQNDYYLKEIDRLFINKYETYLRVNRGCNNNTTVKYIRNMGKIIREALKNDLIKENPFQNIKLRTNEVDMPFLTNKELNAIIEKKISIPNSCCKRCVCVLLPDWLGFY